MGATDRRRLRGCTPCRCVRPVEARAHLVSSLPECSELEKEFISPLNVDSSVEDMRSERPDPRFELPGFPLELPSRFQESPEGSKLCGREVCGSQILSRPAGITELSEPSRNRGFILAAKQAISLPGVARGQYKSTPESA